MVCLWTGKLPADRREDADAILVTAAVAGMGLADLAALAAEIYERSRARAARRGSGTESFEDRALQLETTLGGAGVLGGDLTPACAAAVRRCWMRCRHRPGAEDDRTPAQRYHDGLREAMRRL